MLKMETGWRVLETGAFYPFGQITIDDCNAYRKAEKEWREKFGHAHTKEEIDKLDKEYPLLHNNDVYNFICVIETYAEDCGNRKNGYQPLRKFPNPYYGNEHISMEQRKKNYEYRLELARKQGWNDIEYGTDFSPIDIYLMQCFETLEPFKALPHFIDGKWYMAYDTGDSNRIMALDIIEMRHINHDIRYCKNCDLLFIQSGKNQRYCPACSANYKKIADDNRKRSPRYAHKKIQNYLKNSNKFTIDEIIAFNNESDYYWDTINGKQFDTVADYRSDIDTVADYIAWCEEKHKEFKSIAKTRKQLEQ